jgi:hypothetical protein
MKDWNPPKDKAMINRFLNLNPAPAVPAHIATAKQSIARPMEISSMEIISIVFLL